jgi:short-chain fatty acids transporter
MGIAYGDQWTNMIHPFTVIVLLIMTGLEARQVLAYSAVMFLVAGVPLGLGLYLAALL